MRADFGSEFPGAVVYDVVGHDTFPFGKKYVIIFYTQDKRC